jgi:hypothetical protein
LVKSIASSPPPSAAAGAAAAGAEAAAASSLVAAAVTVPLISRLRSRDDRRIRTDAPHAPEENAHRKVDERRLGVVAQVRRILHGGNHAAAAYAGQFVFQSLDHGGLSAADAGEQFGKLECGDLQHGAPCRENARRC